MESDIDLDLTGVYDTIKTSFNLSGEESTELVKLGETMKDIAQTITNKYWDSEFIG